MAPFRIYDLPWTPSEEERSRLRRLLIICFAVTLILSILLPLLPTPRKAIDQIEEVPPRFAKLVLERKVTPPPPPPPPPKIDPVPRPVEQPRATQPQPAPTVDRTQEARKKAAQAGLLPFQDQLAALRDSAVLDKAAQTKNLAGKVGASTRAERSLITSKVGSGSGGINTASLSRGYGGGAGSLSGHETTQVTSSLGAGDADNVRRSGSGKASRSEEEIALVFDRNKGAIYAIYTRALREKPDLQGKLVLELTISPDGSITRCDVVSSELQDPELERKLVARVKLFRFEARDVGTITVTKPIDFFPA
ncbi:MAG: TonB family protein [Steroidobacter sp.]